MNPHALTHAHPDHQGSSHAICQKLEIPLWCGEEDVPALVDPEICVTLAAVLGPGGAGASQIVPNENSGVARRELRTALLRSAEEKR